MEKWMLDEALGAPHSHDHIGHGQHGNPFYDWWSDCRFKCPICLAKMVHDGEDVSLLFVQALPYRINRRYVGDSEAWFWKDSYLLALRYVFDRFDREYMRERLAEALRAGREHDELMRAVASLRWVA